MRITNNPQFIKLLHTKNTKKVNVTEIELDKVPTKFEFVGFELIFPIRLVESKTLSKDEKAALIYAYSILNHLKEKNLFRGKDGYFTLKCNELVNNNAVMASFFKRSLKALKVTNVKIYDYFEALVASKYVRSSKNGDLLYLLSEKHFYFPELRKNETIADDLFTHRVIINKKSEIEAFGKANNVNLFFVRVIHSKPFTIEKDSKDIIPMTYEETLKLLGLNNRNLVNKAGEFFGMKKAYKFIEITKGEYEYGTYANDGFYTNLKVISPNYAKALTKVLRTNKDLDKSVVSSKNMMNKYFKYEGFRYITNTKVESVVLLVKSVARKTVYKNYIRNKFELRHYKRSAKLIIYDRVLQPTDKRYKTVTTTSISSINTMFKSKRNSLYREYTDFDIKVEDRFTWIMVADSLVQSIKLLRTAVTQNIVKKLVNEMYKLTIASEHLYDKYNYNRNGYKIVIKDQKIKGKNLSYSRFSPKGNIDKLSIEMINIINNFLDTFGDHRYYHLFEQLKIELYTQKALPYDIHLRALLYEIDEMKHRNILESRFPLLKQKYSIMNNYRFLKLVC